MRTSKSHKVLYCNSLNLLQNRRISLACNSPCTAINTSLSMKFQSKIPRVKYTAEEEKHMKRYVQKHKDQSPGSIGFWKTAGKALRLTHSPDSLRCHWKLLQGKSS